MRSSSSTICTNYSTYFSRKITLLLKWIKWQILTKLLPERSFPAGKQHYKVVRKRWIYFQDWHTRTEICIPLLKPSLPQGQLNWIELDRTSDTFRKVGSNTQSNWHVFWVHWSWRLICSMFKHFLSRMDVLGHRIFFTANLGLKFSFMQDSVRKKLLEMHVIAPTKFLDKMNWNVSFDWLRVYMELGLDFPISYSNVFRLLAILNNPTGAV